MSLICAFHTHTHRDITHKNTDDGLTFGRSGAAGVIECVKAEQLLAATPLHGLLPLSPCLLSPLPPTLLLLLLLGPGTRGLSLLLRGLRLLPGLLRRSVGGAQGNARDLEHHFSAQTGHCLAAAAAVPRHQVQPHLHLAHCLQRAEVVLAGEGKGLSERDCASESEMHESRNVVKKYSLAKNMACS
jgi:hypothetical protein